MKWTKFEITSNDVNDILFENRNKAYGAYQLRQQYSRNINIAGALTLALALLIFSLPLLASAPAEEKLVYKVVTIEDAVRMQEHKNKREDPKPKPAAAAPKPATPVATIALVTPTIKDDDKTKNDVADINPDALKKAAISDVTTVGDSLGGNILPTGTGDVVGVSIPTPPAPEPTPDPEAIVDFWAVSEKAQFPGGDAAMMKFLQQHVEYPSIARENNIEGKVVLSFVVSKDGSLSNIKVERGVAGGCTEEAIRVVKKMPRWTAASQAGKAVNVRLTLPIKFKLH